MGKFSQGQQPPYICVPITGITKEAVFKQLEIAVKQAPDMIEWRADFLKDLADTKLVLEILDEMRQKTASQILFTIRSEHEGGEAISLTEAEKVQLIVDVCQQSAVDLVDYETANDKVYVRKINDASKTNGKRLILSYHNFVATPTSEKLTGLAEQAVNGGADIAKFAVMPNNKEDVFRLLAMTKMLDDVLDIPVATMAMGEIGKISRIIGWIYGSVMTFGVGVEQSAPGQIPLEQLRKAIEATRILVPGWQQ